MELLTPELRAQLPRLYTQDGKEDPVVYAKFFFPAGHWTWFVTEGQDDGHDFTFFGYVIGDAEEWGYFSLEELDKVWVRGITVERDIYFGVTDFSKAIAQFRLERGE